MTFVIVDASAFGSLILPDERGDVIPEMLSALRAGSVIAPQHWPLEIANLMRMAVRRKRLDAVDFPEIVKKLRSAAVKIDTETSREAWGQTLVLATPPTTAGKRSGSDHQRRRLADLFRRA